MSRIAYKPLYLEQEGRAKKAESALANVKARLVSCQTALARFCELQVIPKLELGIFQLPRHEFIAYSVWGQRQLRWTESSDEFSFGYQRHAYNGNEIRSLAE